MPAASFCTGKVSIIFFLIFILLFIYLLFGCVGSLLLHMGFLQLRRAGATLHCGEWASHCSGFSCCGARALSTGSKHVGFSSCGTWALERRLSSCGAWAQLLCGMWDLPGPGLELVSPAWAGGFLTTAPLGKSQKVSFRITFGYVESIIQSSPGEERLNLNSEFLKMLGICFSSWEQVVCRERSFFSDSIIHKL